MRSTSMALGVSFVSLLAACGDATSGDEPTLDAAPATSCDIRPECPPSAPDRLNICGRLLDAATNKPLGDDPTLGLCDPAAPTAGGVCSLVVHAQHPLRFALMPTLQPPLQATVTIDGCGYYRALDIQLAGFPYMMITVDDATGVADDHVLTAALTPPDATVVRDLPILSRATDAEWSRQAGLTGQTFAERGALMLTFRTLAGRRAEVTPDLGDRELPPGSMLYFADADARRTTVTPTASRTGANGTALILFSDPGFLMYSGIGGVPEGCSWSRSTQPTIPGVFSVADVIATGNNCP